MSPHLFLRQAGQTTKVPFEDSLVLNAPNGSPLRIGRYILGGGNGAVFFAEKLNARGYRTGICAFKFLCALDEVRRDRFENEIRIIQQLEHRRIAAYHGHGTANFEGGHQVPWLALDLGGPNLRYTRETEPVLEPQAAVSIAIQFCEAVQHLHTKGYIHRDIKPDNFVWARREDRSNVFMIDFGIAKAFDEDLSGRPLEKYTRQGEFVGPANFSSPELLAYAVDKTVQVDLRSDLFQLGMMIWYVLTGRINNGVPCRGYDPTGGQVWEIVVKLLQENPDEREFQSAQEVATRLQQINFPA